MGHRQFICNRLQTIRGMGSKPLVNPGAAPGSSEIGLVFAGPALQVLLPLKEVSARIQLP